MHVIRLATFWSITKSASGRLQYVRSFGAPRLQSPQETVWLVGISPGNGTLTINGELAATLIAGKKYEANITAMLKPRNEARIEVSASENQSLGDITLQIRDH